jgi:hypothetical protein
MSAISQVRYVENRQLDKSKWDECIDRADNGLIYAYSAYLDFMACNWDALVLNDYEAVMPITWKKKYGIYYLYQPFLSASLGLFGKDLTGKMLGVFLKSIPAKFKFWDISLNHGNFFPVPTYNLFERINYVLDLSPSYEILYGSFRDNVKRNIKKAFKSGCTVLNDFPVDHVIELATMQMQSFTKVNAEDFKHFKLLYDHFHKKGKAVTYGIYNMKNELISSCVFLFSHQRAYYILVGNHPDGKTIGAGHALISEFIKDNAGKSLLLDFEGSDIHNIAFFYSSFGARKEKYPGILNNKLPPLLRWLK